MRNYESSLIYGKELKYKTDLTFLIAYIIIARADVVNGGKT